MAKYSSVPFQAQIDTGYCVAACAQMVLAYQNRYESQDYLAHKLAVKPGLGTPTFQVNCLKELKINVV